MSTDSAPGRAHSHAAAGPPEVTYALVPLADVQAGAALAHLDAGERMAYAQLMLRGAQAARHAHAFLAVRALRRLMVASFLALDAGAVQFGRRPSGAPYLRGPNVPLQLSISHSARHVACALSTAVGVGIDVEEADRFAGAPARPAMLARRFFHAQEVGAVEAREVQAQAAAFLQLWTLKEAVLKAHGVGLRVPLSAVEVRPQPPAPTLQWAQVETAPAATLGPSSAVSVQRPARPPQPAPHLALATAWAPLPGGAPFVVTVAPEAALLARLR